MKPPAAIDTGCGECDCRQHAVGQPRDDGQPAEWRRSIAGSPRGGTGPSCCLKPNRCTSLAQASHVGTPLWCSRCCCWNGRMLLGMHQASKDVPDSCIQCPEHNQVLSTPIRPSAGLRQQQHQFHSLHHAGLEPLQAEQPLAEKRRRMPAGPRRRNTATNFSDFTMLLAILGGAAAPRGGGSTWRL